MAAIASEPGTMLGRFRLGRELGRGSWGVVYAAHDTQLDTKVALKVLTANTSPEMLERFKREVLVARSVTHPGICKVFDFHQEDECTFLTMELIEGASLELLLLQQPVMGVERAVDIVCAAAAAVAVAHGQGITHRDLKPSNILVGAEDRTTVVDFGFARVLNGARLTTPGFTVGTLAYAAPELLRGNEATALSDQYSLAVILYRCLSGRHPREARTVEALAASFTSESLIPLDKLNDDVSSELAAVVARALSTEPSERFEDLRAFSAALDDAADASTFVQRDVHDRTTVTRSPWDGDIEAIVDQALRSPTFSSLIRQQLQYTTVLFTDIVGITSYFDRYGDVAGLKKLEQHNRMLLPLVGEHRGVVVKTIGDAIMATFPDEPSAAACAVAMQTRLAAHNAGVGNADHGIHVRIGIHSGHAVVQHADVFGNTVNVAARICRAASAGQILVSASTLEALRSTSFVTAFVGNSELRGKGGAFPLYALEWSEQTRVDPLLVQTLVSRPEDAGSFALESSPGWATTPATLPREQPGDLAARTQVGTTQSGASVVPRVEHRRRTPLDRIKARLADLPPRIVVAIGVVATLAFAGGGIYLVGKRPLERAAERTRAARLDLEERRSRLAAWRAEMEETIRKRQILPGDVPGLDAARAELDGIVRAGDITRAESQVVACMAILADVTIDRAFINAKLSRLKSTYEQARASGSSVDLKEALTKAQRAATARDYVGANHWVTIGLNALAEAK